jgi:hypothetical protein
MHFEYEITVDEFVASQLLYFELSLGRKRVERAVQWFIAGFLFIAVGWFERSATWEPILVGSVGALCLYRGIRDLFKSRYFRRAYLTAGMDGKKFKADLNEDGFEVTGDLCRWRIRWPGVQLKGENERVFMLYAANTIFMFGKKYLNNEQEQELRRLSRLQASPR